MVKRLLSNGYNNEEPERRIYLEAAAHQEVFSGNATELLMLAEEKAGHQEPTENKEKINTDPSTTTPKP
jgi:hypothetical protein